MLSKEILNKAGKTSIAISMQQAIISGDVQKLQNF